MLHWSSTKRNSCEIERSLSKAITTSLLTGFLIIHYLLLSRSLTLCLRIILPWLLNKVVLYGNAILGLALRGHSSLAGLLVTVFVCGLLVCGCGLLVTVRCMLVASSFVRRVCSLPVA